MPHVVGACVGEVRGGEGFEATTSSAHPRGMGLKFHA